MRRTLTLIAVTLTLGLSACSTSDTTEKTGSSNSDDRSTSSINLKADYMVGVGWIPYEEVYEGTTWDRINLREAPTTDAPIVATVDAGTQLELYGVSVACSLVMSRDEWIEYAIDKIDYLPGLFERNANMKMGWYRVDYGGEFVWAHAAFIGTDAWDGIPTYNVIIADHCWNEVYYYNKNGKLERNEHDYNTNMEFGDRVIPFAYITVDNYDWGYLTLQYFGLNPGEPAYDIRRCTPRAFRLHRSRELGKAVPAWFDTLTDDGVVVADYEETGGGVWVADMAGARVMLVDETGKRLSECNRFALPLYLTSDDAEGVWVADPFVERIVRLDGDARPVAIIEDGIIADAISFNPVTRQLWVCGYKQDESLDACLSFYDENGNLLERTDFYIHGALKAVFEKKSDGSMILYARCAGA